MSRALSIELSDAAFAALERRARAAGKDPVDLIIAILEQRFGDPLVAQDGNGHSDEEQKRAARERFARHFGSVNLGRATGADNESIDADLARAYDDRHEEG
jgi:hypothetical protein